MRRMIIKNQKIKNAKSQNKLKNSNQKIFRLDDRFQNYFERTIQLCKNCPRNSVTIRIISQLVASSGSLPANYAEASEAMSKKDFNKSLKTARKEVRESKVWLRGLKVAVDFIDPEFDLLIHESDEIFYILTSILKKTDQK